MLCSNGVNIYIYVSIGYNLTLHRHEAFLYPDHDHNDGRNGRLCAVVDGASALGIWRDPGHAAFFLCTKGGRGEAG